MLVKSEARKNLPGFQILMFCNCVFRFSFSQNGIECWAPGRAMYVRGPPFLKLTFQLSFRRSLLAEYVQLKFTRTAFGSTDVFKFCQYAFIISSKVCVDISWPFHSQEFNMNSSVCHYISQFVSFAKLVLHQTISFTCGWYFWLFSFNTCLLDNTMRRKYLLVTDRGSSRTNHGNLHPVDLFARWHYFVIRNELKYIWKIGNYWS